LAVHYVTSVLGAGILILPGIALEMAGPASILAWLFLAAFSVLFAWVLARLLVEHPDCHGLPLFARCAFGRGCERGVALLLGLAMAAGSYPFTASPRRGAWSISALFRNPGRCRLRRDPRHRRRKSPGLRLGLRLQMAVMGVVVAVLVLAITLALPHARPIDVLAPPSGGWGSVGMAAAVCFFAIVGWENAAPMAEEVSDPEWNVPRAAMLAVAWCPCSTSVSPLVLAAVVSPKAATDFRWSPRSFGRLSARPATGWWNIVALVLILLAANAWVLATSRMLFVWRGTACCRPGFTGSAQAPGRRLG
jgi:amino acid efflux transporter